MRQSIFVLVPSLLLGTLAAQTLVPTASGASVRADALARPSTSTGSRVPIGPTTTPGDADSLYRIDAPGSYYLTGNLRGVSGKSGIEIAASDVTVDLRGFQLLGGSGSLDGIEIEGEMHRHVTLHDGAVSGWGRNGLSVGQGEGLVLERIRSEGNGAYGFVLAARGNTLSGCIARANRYHGFAAGPSSQFRDCSALDNGNNGFDVLGFGTLTGCVSSENGYAGFKFAQGVTASGCSARANEDEGFVVSGGSTVTGCSATDNLTGFRVDGSLVRSCAARRNDGLGFDVRDDACVLENTCEQNGTDGIAVAGQRNRIDGNHVVSHAGGAGIRLIGTDNHVVRNTSVGNLISYLLAPDNGYGVLLSLSSGPITTSNPWANWQD